MFSNATYSVIENAGPAQPVLVLSNPSSMTFTVTVNNTDITATGGSTIGEYYSIRQAHHMGSTVNLSSCLLDVLSLI